MASGWWLVNCSTGRLSSAEAGASRQLLATSHQPLAAAAAVVVLVTAACGRPPAPGPSDVTPAPPADTAISPPPPLTPGPSSWTLHRQPATYRYEIRSEATAERSAPQPALPADSTAGDGPPGGRATVSTVALVTLTLAPHGDSVRLTGVVDSFTVTRGEGIPTPTDSAPRRAQFVATLAPDGRVTAFRRADTGRAVAGHADTNRVDTSRSDTARADTGHVDKGVAGARGCVSSLGPLLGVARDALAPAPVALSVGQTWRDSSTVVTCHGGVEITAITVSDYRVEGSETHASIPAIRLSRTSTTAHTGGGVDHGRALSLTGTGTGRATLYLDAATGALLTSTAESETTLTFGTPREQAGFRQSVRQSVRLVGDR